MGLRVKFSDLLEGFWELRKTVILTVPVHYGQKVLYKVKLAKAKGSERSPGESVYLLRHPDRKSVLSSFQCQNSAVLDTRRD